MHDHEDILHLQYRIMRTEGKEGESVGYTTRNGEDGGGIFALQGQCSEGRAIGAFPYIAPWARMPIRDNMWSSVTVVLAALRPGIREAYYII